MRGRLLQLFASLPDYLARNARNFGNHRAAATSPCFTYSRRQETARLLVQDLLQSQAIQLNQGEPKTLLNGIVIS